MATTIQDYLRLSVTDCKRMGYFYPQAVANGVVTWTQGKEVVASIRMQTNTAGVVPFAVLTYTYKGQPVRTELTLRFAPSNLHNGTGYYYFVCPVTGLSCRNLYLVDGKFISRTAFRPLYSSQVERRRNSGLAYLCALADYEKMLDAPYRRLTYRGRLTPWGRKVEKAEARAALFRSMTIHRAETKGWQSV